MLGTRKKYFDIPLEIVGIKEEGYHVFVNITTNGKPVRMLLDTGASRTVFDVETLKNLHAGLELEENEDKATGLGSDAVDNYIAILDEIGVGGLKVADYQVGLLDLQHVNQSYGRIGMPPIAGVMGSDLLMFFKAVISYKDEKLILEKP